MIIHIAKCSGIKKLSCLCAAIKECSKTDGDVWISVSDKETAQLAWLIAKEIGVKIPYPIVKRRRNLECISYTVDEPAEKRYTF